MKFTPQSTALCSAANDSRSSTVPHAPPIAQAPKLTDETFHPVRPSSRYCMSIFPHVFHMRPVELKVELGAVVQVVALDAHLHDLAFVEHLPVLVAFILDDLEPQRRAELFALGVVDLDIAVFRSHVPPRRAVTIFAAVADHLRRLFQSEVARDIG